VNCVLLSGDVSNPCRAWETTYVRMPFSVEVWKGRNGGFSNRIYISIPSISGLRQHYCRPKWQGHKGYSLGTVGDFAIPLTLLPIFSLQLFGCWEQPCYVEQTYYEKQTPVHMLSKDYQWLKLMTIREEVWHLKIAVDPSKSSGFIANFALAKSPHFSVTSVTVTSPDCRFRLDPQVFPNRWASEAWALVCLEEFFAQGDQEKLLGIPVGGPGFGGSGDTVERPWWQTLPIGWSQLTT
jgi:hypothetical protein